MKRIMAFAMSIILCLFMFIGCSSKTEDETTPDTTSPSETTTESATETLPEGVLSNEEATLSIYAQYSDDDTKVPYDYAVEQLKTAYPNVTLNLEVQAQDDGQKLMTYAATGNLPDIYQVALAQIENFKQSGNIMVLNDVAEATGFKDKVFESAQNILYNEDGNIYAFPYAGNEYVMWYYNKAIFEKYNVEVPKTFDELLTAIDTFNSNGITPMAIFGSEGWITSAMFDVLATRWDAGGIAKLDNGEGSATEDAYVNAAKMMNTLVKAGMFQGSAPTTNYDQASQMFLNGEAAMFLNGQWYMTDATTALGQDVDWMYYPSYDEASYEAGKTAWSGGGAAAGYAVNPDSKHAQLAAEVAAFLSEKYCEAKVMYRGTPLVALDVDVEPQTEFPAMMQKLQADLPGITSITKFDWHLSNATFKTALEDQTKYLLVKDYTPEEVIKELDNSLN
ncbi:ABC transporter substrate-binding protein [Anaeromicropila populeti]|uniref:Raffinose/stachyose/melibiose transport system substrate-binding protein n=1 Tax=Anaeromicropila populeti TaxID=37658 RepID=A0A1I6IQA6_9FIRM|nr:extracellular solute-binding protein [Anaeromicropila populeti]SFR68809.1 raffinose/stachyose/melibiose transport system substrate-binding protein [Anaeromicropila populeti]